MNKTFNAIVTPLLFREVDVGRKVIGSLRAVAGCGHLTHVRKLSVVYGINADGYHDIVRQMLPKMPLLESFTYVFKHRFGVINQ